MKAKLYKVLDQYHLYDGDKAIATTIVGNPMLLPNLSKQNCEEIFGVIDVEKLADEEYSYYYFEGRVEIRDVFRDGFNKAMELNKDRVFTLEDMRKGIQFGEDNTDMYSFDTVISDKEVNEFIQSLQQPTEIEIEMELEIDTSKLVGGIYGHKQKLDSEGCLILKRKI